MVEDRRPQVQDQPLAEGGGESAGQQSEPGLRDRDQRDEQGQPGDRGAVAALHDGRDDPAGEHRSGHRQQRGHHTQQKEEGEPAAVRAGEGGDAAQAGPGERAAVLLGVDRAVQRCPGGDFHVHGPNARTSTKLQVKHPVRDCPHGAPTPARTSDFADPRPLSVPGGIIGP